MIEAIPLQSSTPIVGTPLKPSDTSRELRRSTSPSSRSRIQSASAASSSFQSPKKPKVPSRQVSASPSPPNVPITITAPPPRSPIKKVAIEKYYDSPRLSSRSLSYEHLQKEKRIQNKLSAIKANNEMNSSYNPPTPHRVTTLFLSEKVAFHSSDGQENRSRGRYPDESCSLDLTNKSQELLNSLTVE
jgi:hypothetical protein